MMLDVCETLFLFRFPADPQWKKHNLRIGKHATDKQLIPYEKKLIRKGETSSALCLQGSELTWDNGAHDAISRNRPSHRT